MRKRGLVIFSLVFFVSIFLLGFASAVVSSCNVRTGSCNAGETSVMKLSSTTNAHGSSASASNSYNTYLCCDGNTGTGTACTGTNNLLRLFSDTNAHAQIPSYTSYTSRVCYEDLFCTYVTGTSCNTNYPISTVSLSSTTNAHIAQAGYYPNQICCSSGAGAQCGNSIIETGETCDDGNQNNYDGCSYPGCAIDPGYICYQPIVNGPSCCYSQSPVTYWIKGGSEFVYGSIAASQGFSFYVYEDYCLSPGTARTASIYKSRTLASDSLITTVQLYSGASGYISGGWLISSADIAKIGVGTSTLYFVLDEPTTGSSVTSKSVEVVVDSICGDGILSGNETCDDGDSVSGDGCSSTCAIESGYACTGEPSVCQKCGNGVIEGTETCDDGDSVSGDGCSSTCAIESGYTCTNQPSICSTIDLCQGVSCPVGQNCDSNTGNCIQIADTCASLGYECGTVNGEVCGSCASGKQCALGQCVPIPQCSINSASWSATQATEGDNVNLNVGVSNCDGTVMTFVIKENDGAFNVDDDVSVNPSSQLISTGQTIVSVNWQAEYHSDIDLLQTDPPEYYFIASIDSEGLDLKSANELQVLEQNAAQCLGIAYCSQYSETECGVLSCSLTHYSEINYYENFDGDRCAETSNWGCVWDSANGICNANQEITTQCGVCGNYLVDYEEQCDDGNSVSGDGCSSTCQFESLDAPCSEGTTLCSDGTCSIECRDTDTGPSSCDYDEICDSNEGCTCSDCDAEVDSCVSGTVCNIEDSFCCDPQSDGVCNPYCSFTDPDCGVSTCGDGFRESGEQCDDGNPVSGDGCSYPACNYEIISEPPCPEGTALCNDNTCSLNCFYTDDGYNYTYIADNCDAGLVYSATDNACCDADYDLICNPYCSFTDPDCGVDVPFTSVDNCGYFDNSHDDCDDGILERNLTAIWTGEIEQPASCANIVDRLVCPARIEVPFFSILQFVLAVILIIIIYFLIKSKIEEEQKRRSKKKTGSKKRRK